jgi:hypothetical protein
MRRLSADLLTVEEAARKMGSNPTKVREKCESGDFPPAVRHRNDWAVSAKKLDRWLCIGAAV